MKSITLGLLLCSLPLASGQEAQEAPAPVDQGLRARVSRFYKAYLDGKFVDAYQLVADDSRDAYMAADKNQYKSCDTLKITYSENFATASVMEVCLNDVRFHGEKYETKVPLTTTWKLLNGEWFWAYVKPTRAQTPFSPTGWVDLPKEGAADKSQLDIPHDPAAAARNILSKITLDKQEIRLVSYETSKDVLHVRNEMPGWVSLTMDKMTQPGMKVTIAKPDLAQHEETAITFEYLLDTAEITCGDCARRVKGTITAQLHIVPTNQVFPITITFGIPPEAEKQLPEAVRKKITKQ
jgi:hypothetical protein